MRAKGPMDVMRPGDRLRASYSIEPKSLPKEV